jgi:hypothetical protein
MHVALSPSSLRGRRFARAVQERISFLPTLCVVASAFWPVACGTVNPGSSNSGHYSVATHDMGQATLLARAGGTLEGQANADGTACFWFGKGSGEKLTLVWPPGYFAAGQPLSLFDKSGAKVASAGQQVTVGGGMAPTSLGKPAGCTSAQDIWLVGEVIAAK